MKLKNITKESRQLTDFGQIILVGPGEIIEVIKPKYEENTFVVYTQNRKKRKEQTISRKEVKLNDTSKRTGRMDRDILNHSSA